METVWTTFLKFWAAVSTGHPDIIRAYQGSFFTTPKFAQISSTAGVNVNLSGIESHNSLGAREKYHNLLRNLYLKIRFSYRRFPMYLRLSLSINSMNDKMNSDFISPSLLLFVFLPRFQFTRTKIPSQQE